MKNLNFSTSILIIILAASFFYSCAGNTPTNGSGVWTPVDTSSFTYPFTTGSTWNYKSTYSAENIRPDSIRHYFAEYPFYGSGTITILYDTLINGVTTRVFLEEYKEIQEGDTNIFRSRYYYANYDTALVCYAKRYGWGGSGMPYSANNKIAFKKNGKLFSKPFEVSNYFINGMYRSADSLYIENPPAVVLKYPVVTGTEWIAKYYQGNPWFIKKYVSFVNLFLGASTISCIKTERKISSFSDIEYYDYYSKAGQLKKDFLAKDMIVTNYLGYEIGRADTRELYEITSFNIVQP
jgi:hypothetical protein